MVILLGDAAEVLKTFVDGCISLTVTSPPYDNLRTYGGFSFDFEAIAKELYRVTKDGGVIVWIVGDQVSDGDESGTSFRQALYFKDIGFKLNDTMIYANTAFSFPRKNQYHQVFQYMFVFSKGSIKTFNGIKDRPNSSFGEVKTHQNIRTSDDSKTSRQYKFTIPRYGLRYNIWYNTLHGQNATNDKDSHLHPATMQDALPQDLIITYSNEGDLVLDPFAGSGTTLKAAQQLNRKWVGIEINPDYVQLAKKRLTPYIEQQRLEQFIE